jgi:hypothetical protein
MIDLALAVRLPLSASARLTLFVLANRADDEGDCWPLLPVIIQETGLSRRGVQYAIDELERAALVHCSDGRGRGRGKVFHLSFDQKSADLAPIEGKKDAMRAPYLPVRAVKGEVVAPIEAVKGANDDEKRRKSQQIKGANHDIPPTPPYMENPKKETKKGREIHPPYPPDFETWWDACPSRMRRSGKSETYDAWAKAAGRMPPLAEMLRVLALQAASHDWTKEGGQFVPMATTYLNRSRWEAEVSAYVPNGKNGHGPPPEHGNMAPVRAEPTPVERAWASASPEEQAMGRTAFYAAFNARRREVSA